MWAWWHKLCERYFANWKKVYKHQFAFFWKIQEEKRIKFASVKARTTVAWWCRATATTSPSQRLTWSANHNWLDMILSFEQAIFSNTVVSEVSLLFLCFDNHQTKHAVIAIMPLSPVWFDVRPTTLVTTAHYHLHGRHHHCDSCAGDTCRSHFGQIAICVKNRASENLEPKGSLHRPSHVLCLNWLCLITFSSYFQLLFKVK